MNFLKRFFHFREYVRSSFILIRVGKGVGITVYKIRADENLIRRAATQLFKIAYRAN